MKDERRPAAVFFCCRNAAAQRAHIFIWAPAVASAAPRRRGKALSLPQLEEASGCMMWAALYMHENANVMWRMQLRRPHTHSHTHTHSRFVFLPKWAQTKSMWRQLISYMLSRCVSQQMCSIVPDSSHGEIMGVCSVINEGISQLWSIRSWLILCQINHLPLRLRALIDQTEMLLQ